MKRTLRQVNAAREAKNTAYLAKLAEAKGLQEDESKAAELDAALTEAEALKTEVDALDEEAKTAIDVDAEEGRATERLGEIRTVVNRPQMPTGETRGTGKAISVKAASVPAHVLANTTVTAFKGTQEERNLKAYGFAQWFRATQLRDTKASKWCQDNGIETRAHVEGQNALGGALVPVQFDSDIIDLREKYGVFRANAKHSTMTSDTKVVPRRTGGLTAYAVGELQEITESQKGWDNVQLNAKKFAVLAKYSSEVDEDAIISMGNDLAEEIAYAFSVKEDLCGFSGDGTSTYHGIVGLGPKLLGLSGTIANIAGLQVASGNAWSEITLVDFNNLKGKLPVYARTRSPKWYASHVFYDQVMERLMLAAGGVTAAEIAAGRVEPRFMGYPVELTVALPQVEANSQIACYFGALPLAALFGDRRQTAIAMSEHVNFANDEWAIRGTERIDINVHDVGNASATAADRVPGPIVGLITAAS